MTQTPSRDWQKDMDACLTVNDWHEYPWEAGSEEDSGVWNIYEIIPDEPCDFVAECETELVTDFIMTAHEALPYWLQEAKIYKQSYEATLTAYTSEKSRADAAEDELNTLRANFVALKDERDFWEIKRTQHKNRADRAETREQRLKEEVEASICLIEAAGLNGRAASLKSLLRALYPDTPAPKEGTTDDEPIR